MQKTRLVWNRFQDRGSSIKYIFKVKNSERILNIKVWKVNQDWFATEKKLMVCKSWVFYGQQITLNVQIWADSKTNRAYIIGSSDIRFSK